MSATLESTIVTNGNDFVWPTDAPDAIKTNAGIPKYEFHMIQVAGVGTATITADQGVGAQAVDTLTAESNTYRLPNSDTITIDVAGGDITLSIKSYNSGTVS